MVEIMSAYYRYLNTPHESETHHTTVHSDIYQLICGCAPWLYLFMASNYAMSVAFYLQSKAVQDYISDFYVFT